MKKWIPDYDDNDLLHPLSDGTAIDSHGNVHMRISDDLSVDLSTNELHFTPGWETESDDS